MPHSQTKPRKRSYSAIFGFHDATQAGGGGESVGPDPSIQYRPVREPLIGLASVDIEGFRPISFNFNTFAHPSTSTIAPILHRKLSGGEFGRFFGQSPPDIELQGLPNAIPRPHAVKRAAPGVTEGARVAQYADGTNGARVMERAEVAKAEKAKERPPTYSPWAPGHPGYSGGVPPNAGHSSWNEHHPHSFDFLGRKSPN